MKYKKLVWQLLVVLGLGAIIWYALSRNEDSMAQFVPDHAAWFAEIDHPLDVLKGSQKGIRIFANPNLTLFAEWQKELAIVQNLLSKEAEIKNFLQETTLGISAHMVAGKNAGYIFYTPLNAKKQESLNVLLKRQFGSRKDYIYREREYMSQKIVEITFLKSNTTFSLANTGEVAVGSFSGFLVEEVVRKSGLIFKPNFAVKLRKDARYASISTKPVRVFINLATFDGFLHQYFSRSMVGLGLIQTAGTGLVIGFDAPKGPDWASDGYLLKEDPAEKNKHQHLLQSDLAAKVPEPISVLFHQTTGNLWQKMNALLDGSPNPTQAGWMEQLQPEALFAMVEGEGLKKYNQLLVCKAQNPDAFEAWLAGGPEKKNLKLVNEFPTGHVYQIIDSSTAQSLGGKTMQGWKPLFFYRDKALFAFSEDLNLLTRSKNSPQKATSATRYTARSRHLQFSFQASRCIPLLADYAIGPLKANFGEWLPLFKSIQEISLSDNGEEDNPSIIFRIVWKVPSGIQSNWEISHTFQADTVLTTGPFALHQNRDQKVRWAFQDRKFQGIVLDEDLRLIQKSSFGSFWTARPQFLERQAKDPYLFAATKGGIYLLDGKGNRVSGFPLSLPDSSLRLEYARAIDYDGSQNYRFFMVDRYGSVFAAGMEGKFLEGWNPRKNEHPLSQAPCHVRIGDKDFILLLDNMGLLHFCNRKGEKLFPSLNMEGRSNQPMFIEYGLEPSKSYIYILTELGLMKKISLAGEEVSRIQLLRNDRNTQFQFCIDQWGKTFSIARIEPEKLTIFDQSYKAIFTVATKGPDMLVQYFHFGAGNRIFAITDQKNGELYLYDENGQQLNPEALPNQAPVDIISSKLKDGFYKLLLSKGAKISLVEFAKD